MLIVSFLPNVYYFISITCCFLSHVCTPHRSKRVLSRVYVNCLFFLAKKNRIENLTGFRLTYAKLAWSGICTVHCYPVSLTTPFQYPVIFSANDTFGMVDLILFN